MGFFNLQEILMEIWKLVGFIIAGAIGYYVPKISKRIKNFIQQRYFSASLKKSVEIKIKLAEVKTELGAKRIYLFQFHNGTVYLGDHSFHKYSMSAIFEIVNQGLSRDIQNMQSIPLSKNAELISTMMDNDADYLIVGDHRGCDMTFSAADMEDILYSMQPTTLAFVKVLNNRKQFIGLICAIFDEEINRTKFAEMRQNTNLNSLLVEIRGIL